MAGVPRVARSSDAPVCRRAQGAAEVPDVWDEGGGVHIFSDFKFQGNTLSESVHSDLHRVADAFLSQGFIK